MMIEFPYCASCGIWSVSFDAFCYPVHEFDWSYICEIVYHNFIFTLRQRGVYLRL